MSFQGSYASVSRMPNPTSSRVSPTAPDPELTENVTVLMTTEMRAFLLGTRAVEGARSEGAVVRALLEDAISAYRDQHPRQYATNAARGTQILTARAKASAT